MKSGIVSWSVALHRSWSAIQIYFRMMLVIAWGCYGALKPVGSMGSTGCLLVMSVLHNPQTPLCIACVARPTF